jgi:hypothetical protein
MYIPAELVEPADRHDSGSPGSYRIDSDTDTGCTPTGTRNKLCNAMEVIPHDPTTRTNMNHHHIQPTPDTN